MRMVVLRSKGDIITGFHVRDFGLEARAAAAAARLHLAGEEPPRKEWPWPQTPPEGEVREATAQEYESYYRMRLRENWEEMQELFAEKPQHKTTRKEALP